MLLDKPIPPFELPGLTVDSSGLSAGELAGRPLLVNVFASWCAPCRHEIPLMVRLASEGVPIYGIAYKDDPAATRAFLEELGDPYALVLVDRDGRAGLDLGISGVPETYAVDAQGIIVAKHAGSLLTDAEVERLTSALR